MSPRKLRFLGEDRYAEKRGFRLIHNVFGGAPDWYQAALEPPELDEQALEKGPVFKGKKYFSFLSLCSLCGCGKLFFKKRKAVCF